MYSAVSMVISESRYPVHTAYAGRNAEAACRLYNAALFRIRQVFTGWDKQRRTANEQAVFDEIAVMQAAYPHIRVNRVLSYRVLDAVMRANNNPDFFAGLPMQTAQHVLKEAATVFKAWLSAVREYKRYPERFLGLPRMPKYLKSGAHTFCVTNQDAVLYPVYRNGAYTGQELKLPKLKERLFLRNIPADCTLKEVHVKPYYGKYPLLLTLETEDTAVLSGTGNLAGVDLGTDNIAAIVSTDLASRVYKGGAVLSETKRFFERRAEAVSIITRGTTNKGAKSRHLDRLSLRHDCFMQDAMHKISADIIRYCRDHHVGTLVIGVNRLWKQNVTLGRQNNRKFVSVPHEKLRFMIRYKAALAGITVIEQEESYTSKADVFAGDPMPVCGSETGKPVFSGTRISRGMYRLRDGTRVNADSNGAANILRKAFPDAWKETEDFRFLAFPESVTFKTLNRARTA